MKEVYDFKHQAVIGRYWELAVIDALNRRDGFLAWESDTFEQQCGIDLFFTNKKGDRYSMDVKADEKCHLFGNFFIETLSHVRNRTPSWLFTSHATLIGFVNTETCQLYPVPLSKLLSAYERDWKRRPRKTVINDYKHSEGIPVPIGEVSALCNGLIDLSHVVPTHER